MHRWGPRRVIGAVVACLSVAAGLSIVPGTATAASCSNLFSGAFAQDLAQRYPGIAVTAAVYDTRTGCWHHLNHGMQITTASVIKAQVLGAVLLQAQQQGRGLTAWERSKIGPMIFYSFNPETSSLYAHVGYERGMYASDPSFGVTATTHTATFGLTRSTAIDRTNVALRLLWGGGGLGQAGREEAWRYMANVHPLQEWGISAGVPAGWEVAQKNGFYPSSGIGWRVGSSGFVRQHSGDQGYAITVMTQGATNQRTGVRLVEEVSRRAAAALTVGPGEKRPVDRARCVLVSGGESWDGVAARLGLPASRAGEVRTTSGGNPTPLSGQQACSPDIPAEPSSSVNGRYRPVATDLDCDGRDDLVWFGPGGHPDARWAGSPDRRFRRRALTVGGPEYVPVGGDFDADGCGDVLWYGRGSLTDRVWYGGAGGVTSRALDIPTTGYAPRTGDFDADGHDDVLWYLPGAGRDVLWFGRPERGVFSSLTVSVSGAYDPVIADLDGDGADDVFWYGRGGAPDAFWRGQVGARSFVGMDAPAVSGAFRPVAGDGNGDGADEITWYAPGSAPDQQWSGLPGSVVVRAITINGDYLPVSGDFDGDDRDDITWYGPGGRPDHQWWGRGDGGVDSAPLLAV